MHHKVVNSLSSSLSELYDEISLHSAVLGRYCLEVRRCGERNPPFTWISTPSMSNVMNHIIREYEKYLIEFSKKRHATYVQYWKKFESLDPVESEGYTNVNSKTKSLFVFSERNKVREHIDFYGIEKPYPPPVTGRYPQGCVSSKLSQIKNGIFKFYISYI